MLDILKNILIIFPIVFNYILFIIGGYIICPHMDMKTIHIEWRIGIMHIKLQFRNIKILCTRIQNVFGHGIYRANNSARWSFKST